MTRSYRPNSKGENPNSYQKHELIKAAIDAQIAVASKLLHKRDSALIIDLHAGDGHGIEPAQLNLFGPQESVPTALIALAAAERLNKYCRVGLRLFERDATRRHTLHDAISLRNPHLDLLSIEENHKALQEFAFFRGYDYVLAISDPNGPKAAGTDVLIAIAQQRTDRRLDVLAVIATGALARIRGLKSNSPSAQGARRTHDEFYWWHDKPEEWAHRLNRQIVVASSPIKAANGGMQQKIFLITNFTARPPAGFRIVFDAKKSSEFPHASKQEGNNARR